MEGRNLLRGIPVYLISLSIGFQTSCAVTSISSWLIKDSANAQIATPIESIGDERRVFLKKDGWPIPEFTPSKQSEFSYEQSTEKGITYSVAVKQYDLDPFIVDEEPFSLIGSNLGKIRLRKVNTYSVGEHLFCYRIQANKVHVDEATNKVVDSMPVLFFFSYYDENGDGIFETLILDETDDKGISGFWSRPHLPRWIS